MLFKKKKRNYTKDITDMYMWVDDLDYALHQLADSVRELKEEVAYLAEFIND